MPTRLHHQGEQRFPIHLIGLQGEMPASSCHPGANHDSLDEPIKTNAMVSLQDLDDGVRVLDNIGESPGSDGANSNFVPFTSLTCDITYSTNVSKRVLKLKQKLPENTPIAPLFSDVWTGSCVWECSLLISRTIETDLVNDFADKSILVLEPLKMPCQVFQDNLKHLQDL